MVIETPCLRRESAKAGRRNSSNVDEVGGVETGWGASGDDAREEATHAQGADDRRLDRLATPKRGGTGGTKDSRSTPTELSVDQQASSAVLAAFHGFSPYGAR